LPRSTGKFKAKDELEKEEWTRIIQDGLNLGIWEWSIIGGGEPFLRHDTVFQILDVIKRFDSQQMCEIITNGTLLKREDIKRLVKIGLDRIIFSIDAPDAETHDYLRGVKGTFRKVSENLKNLSLMKEQLKRDKPRIKVNMVLNKRNYKKIVEMVEFVKRMGASELALHPMREYFEFEHQIQHLILKPSEEKELGDEIKRAQEISKNLGIFLNLDMVKLGDGGAQSSIKEKIMKVRCFEPFYSFLIDPSGNIGHCGPSGSGNTELNPLQRSLKNIWYGKILNDVRKKIGEGGSLECCSKCGLTDMAEHLRKEMLKFVSEG
jgi:MoaA/NifB/PqqE/SkfB family radical SAM enzyme